MQNASFVPVNNERSARISSQRLGMGEFIMTSNKKLKVFSNTKNGVARCGWPDDYYQSSVLSHFDADNNLLKVDGVKYLSFFHPFSVEDMKGVQA